MQMRLFNRHHGLGFSCERREPKQSTGMGLLRLDKALEAQLVLAQARRTGQRRGGPLFGGCGVSVVVHAARRECPKRVESCHTRGGRRLD